MSVINSWGYCSCLYVNKRTYDFMTKREIKRAEGLATRWYHLLQQSTATIHSGQSGLTVASHVVAVSRIDQEAALIQPHNTTGKAARMWDQPMKRKNAIKTRVVSEFWLTHMAKSFVRLDKFQESNSGRGKTVLIVFGTRGNKFWRQTPKSYLICDSILSNKRWQLKGTRYVETLYGGQFTRIINSVDENKLSSLISTNLHGYDLIGYFYSKAIDGNYTAWSKWSECSVTCGRGSRNRSRECTNPSPQYGGKDCNVLGPANDIQECNKSACRKSCSKAVLNDFMFCCIIYMIMLYDWH